MRYPIAIALAMFAQASLQTPALAQQPPAAAAPASPGQSFRDCPECPEMVVAPAGKFMMGAPDAEAARFKGEFPQREVTFAGPFAIGKFEVTFAEWDACVAGGGCALNKTPDDRGWGRDKRPVINVSWNDAKAYVTWLSAKTGKTYRLPTEAEWEYAARAGTTTAYVWGDEIGEGNANCRGCRTEWEAKHQTAPVGSFKPNPFGLFDMHGNISEWTEDCYGEYANAPADGKVAPEAAKCPRVLRGGSWSINPRMLRSAMRIREVPGFRTIINGFRIARSLP